MSTWLVDTHALLWFLSDDPALSTRAMQTIESAEHVLLVSAASLWEIAIKTTIGRLQAPDNLPQVIRTEGFETLDITAAHAWAVRLLPQGAHKDPFDRLLVSQALTEDLAIISGDTALDEYAVKRHW